MTTVQTIIDDVLRSGEPQLRRNGAVALAVAASPESLARLARLALDDPDESVRACAEAEIQSLPADSAEQVAGVLFQALDNPAVGVRSYALLGRVRSAGWAGPRPRGTLLRRLLLALWFQSRATGRDRRTPRSTASWRGILGVCLAAALLALATAAFLEAFPTPGELLLDGLIAVAIVLTTGIAVTSRVVPTFMHFDRLAASVLALGVAGLSGLAIGILIVLVLAGFEELPGRDWMPVLVAWTLLPLGARAGALIAAGITQNPTTHRYAQVLVGSTIAALLIGTAATLSISENSAVGTIFTACLIASVGIANVFATIDETPPADGALLGKVGKPIVVLVLAAVCGVAVLGVVRLLSRTSFNPAGVKMADIALTGAAEHREIGLSALPVEVRMRLAAPATVKLVLAELNTGSVDVAIAVKADSNDIEPLHADDPDPPVLERPLPAGNYTIYLGEYQWVGGRRMAPSPQQSAEPAIARPRTMAITFVARDLSRAILHSSRAVPYTLRVTVTK